MSLTKNAVVPLQYSKKARERVIVGLNWDQRSKGPSIGERLKNIGRNVKSYDLDLACVMYNAKGEALDGVSSRPDEAADQSGKVYHSGDDDTGKGDDLDDEQISVELKDLPSDIHHIIFVTEIQSAHTFKDIISPYMRVADGATNKDQFVHELTDRAGDDKTAYVFARLFRREGAWMIHFIDEYLDGTQVGDWVEALKKYTQ